jgi:hypothetical protein
MIGILLLKHRRDLVLLKMISLRAIAKFFGERSIETCERVLFVGQSEANCGSSAYDCTTTSDQQESNKCTVLRLCLSIY